MMAESKSAQAQPGLPGLAASLVANGLLAGLFMGCIFLALSLGRAADGALQGRTLDVPATIVLRENVTEEAAAAIATRLRNETPGLQADVIGRIAGRALLGLQEPWMQRLPDFELAELPVLIEVRHPRLLDKGFDAAGFVSALESLPEADFVAFNVTGLDRFAEFADTARTYSRTATRGFAALGATGALLLTLILCLRRRYATVAAALVSAGFLTILTVGAGWIAAAVILSRLPTGLPATGAGVPSLLAALALTAAGFALTELVRVRRSRRVRRRAAA